MECFWFLNYKNRWVKKNIFTIYQEWDTFRQRRGEVTEKTLTYNNAKNEKVNQTVHELKRYL